MAKDAKQVRINAAPGGVAHAASTLVTPTEVIGGTPNVIGGWVFGPTTLSNNGAVLNSEGWIQAGAGTRIVRMDAQDATYRLWAGAVAGADAPFSVDTLGVLRATGAIISGDLEALTGHIGGFDIGADYVRDVADSMGIASTVTAGDDVRFWAGDTFANRATADFRVTEAGLLTASGATIEGALTATTGELIDLSVSGTLTLVASGIIESDNFVTGLAGWQIDHNGDAEFANIHARGRIDTAVFQYDQISAVSGSILVTPTAGALAAAYTTAGTLTIEGAGFAFATGDVVRIRAKDTLGAVQQVWVTVTRTGADNVYTTVLGSGDNKTWPVGTAVLGYGTGGGSLMMTAASALDGPRYSVLTHSTSPWTDESEIGRFGFLDDWQTYAGVDYGIAIGDYAGGNYLLYGTTTGFMLKAGDGDVQINELGMSFEMQTSIGSTTTVRWMDGATQKGGITAYTGPAGGEAITVVSAIAGTNINAVMLMASGTDEVAQVKAFAPPTGHATTIELLALDVWVGDTTHPDDLTVVGDYKNYRNATTYTGYLFMPLDTFATSTAFDGDLYDVDNDEAVIDLSASFGLPAGIKAVSLGLWSTCATAGKELSLRRAAGGLPAVVAYTQVAGQQSFCSGIVPCDANGDIYFTTTAVHGAECAVYIRINGYWI